MRLVDHALGAVAACVSMFSGMADEYPVWLMFGCALAVYVLAMMNFFMLARLVEKIEKKVADKNRRDLLRSHR